MILSWRRWTRSSLRAPDIVRGHRTSGTRASSGERPAYVVVQNRHGPRTMSKKMSPVVHFEMPAADRVRMAKFYTSAFGWQAQMMGPEMGDYVVVTTTESEENGTPKTPGSINGGFYPKKEDWPAQYPSVVIA